jgi:hypothetical protein
MQHLADRYGRGPVQLSEIAERQKIPAKFPTAILTELSRFGIVHSQRGNDGGLARDPADRHHYGDLILQCAVRSLWSRAPAAWHMKSARTACRKVTAALGDAAEGRVSEALFRQMIVWISLSRLAGTLLAQFLLVPAASAIALIANVI